MIKAGLVESKFHAHHITQTNVNNLREQRVRPGTVATVAWGFRGSGICLKPPPRHKKAVWWKGGGTDLLADRPGLNPDSNPGLDQVPLSFRVIFYKVGNSPDGTSLW